MSDADHSPRRHEWRLALQTVAGFWVLHLIYRTTIAALRGDMAGLFDPTLNASLVFGFVLTLLLCAVLALAARRGLAAGLGAAALLSLPFSLGFASTEFALYYNYSAELNGVASTRRTPDGTVVVVTASGEVSYQRPGRKAETVQLAPLKQRVRSQAAGIVAANASGWYFFYFGLGSFFVGMSSAARLRRAERRAADSERFAQESQLRALRYQVNPHFLFNTLNSLSALVMARRDEQAELMILKLSAFFRSTLAIEPTDDIPMHEEIALQRLYLDIEAARFPDRLRVEVDLPDALATARVPALILQPLVENAIKFGVARSRGSVLIRIAATQTPAGALSLVVENSGKPGRPGETEPGTGVGLPNVRERLTARFGDAASCEAGFVAPGLFRVAMVMPLVHE